MEREEIHFLKVSSVLVLAELSIAFQERTVLIKTIEALHGPFYKRYSTLEITTTKN